MSKHMIIVTGCFGAPIEAAARKLAAQENLTYISLDEEITKRDGRSIKRLVMMNGEHGYRNAEYEILNEFDAECADSVDQHIDTGSDISNENPDNAEDSEAEAAAHLAMNSAADPAAKLITDSAGYVIAAGDGLLYDDDSREVAMCHKLFIIGMDMTMDELWANAKAVKDSYHAFMSFGTEEEQRSAFEQLILRQRAMFAEVQAVVQTKKP